MIVHPSLAKMRFEESIQALLDSPALFEQAGIRLVSYDFPVLLVELHWRTKNEWLRLRIDATDYNYRPLHGWWVNKSGSPQLRNTGIIPQGAGFQPDPPANGEKRTWLCFKGWRDYHDHAGHQDTAWAAIRNAPQYKPLALLQQMHSTLNNSQVSAA